MPKGALADQVAFREGMADKRVGIVADLGGDENVSRLKADMVTRYLETDVLCSWLSHQLLRDGMFTGKGRLRAMFTAYMTVLDRQHRIAIGLGLERRPKTVISPLDYIAGKGSEE